ncbi:MAG: PEGA domain-containing protein [Cellulosilyticum sp.]|nr:PEGA domain-containing protein [Cellulosilyticum sp.]
MIGAGTYKVVVKVDGYKSLETEMTIAKNKSFTEAVFTLTK